MQVPTAIAVTVAVEIVQIEVVDEVKVTVKPLEAVAYELKSKLAPYT